MGKIKYYYNGMSLLDYGETIGITRRAMKKRIQVIKENPDNANLSDDEVVTLALQKDAKIAYLYKGTTLAQYCKENNLALNTIKARIQKLKGIPEYKDFTLEEITDIAINPDYELKYSKYKYNGVSLSEYCREHNISYRSLYKRIAELRRSPEYEDASDEKLVEIALGMKSKQLIYYKGIRLPKYCRDNGLDCKKIMRKISSIKVNKKYKHLSYSEITKLVIEGETSLSPYKYVYAGMGLKEYCIKNGLSYQSIIKDILMIRKAGVYDDLDDTELIKFIIETDSAIVRLSYNEDILKYLSDNNIDKEQIIEFIKELRMLEGYSITQPKTIVKNAIDLYVHSLNCKDMFAKLKEGNLGEGEIKIITNYLRISSIAVRNLSKKMKSELAVMVINYFGENKNGFKTITISELERINKLTKKEIEEIEFIDLVKLYKSNLIDTREEILKVKEKELRIFIDIYSSDHDVDVDEFMIEDLISEYKFHIVNILDQDYHSDVKQLVKKINNKEGILEILNKELEYRDTVIYKSDEEIEDPKDLFGNLYNEDFSYRTTLLFDALSQEEEKFIINKFKHNYSSEELAEIYKVDVEKVKAKEEEILEKLTRRGYLERRNKR